MSKYEDYDTTSRNYDNQRVAMGADVAASMIQFHSQKPLKVMLMTFLFAGITFRGQYVLNVHLYMREFRFATKVKAKNMWYLYV